MLTLRILIKKYYFYIFTSHIHIFLLWIQSFIHFYWKLCSLSIETIDVFLRLFVHLISLLKKNDANSETVYTSKDKRRTNCATFFKLRGGEGAKRKSNKWRVKRVRMVEGSVKKIFRGMKWRDFLFEATYSSTLVLPVLFFAPCSILLEACPIC